jgi:hypothetical protein
MYRTLLENWPRLCATGKRRPFYKAYTENTKTTYNGKRVSIECKNGLWSVDAPTLEDAERAAKFYFQMYYHDGEYDS